MSWTKRLLATCSKIWTNSNPPVFVNCSSFPVKRGSKALKISSKIRFCAALIGMAIMLSPAAYAGESIAQRSGFGLGFKLMQDVWRGISEKPKMTTCRLAGRSSVGQKQICVYSGANHTYLAIYNETGGFCSNSIDCRYSPDKSKSVRSLIQTFHANNDR